MKRLLILFLLFFVSNILFAQSKQYNPRFPEDVKTIEEAKKKIIAILGEAPNLSINGVRVEKISYTDSEIDFDLRKKDNKIFYYKDVETVSTLTVDQSGNIYIWEKLAENSFRGKLILTGSYPEMIKIADYLYFIQQLPIRQKEKEDEKLFETLASAYRALAVKPAMTEEQRKFIVQANAMTQRKSYSSAIELYKKALAVSATDCPDAYSNMALLEAQIGNYRNAVTNMKKYLKLVPEAEDARSAQDKIYEWEINVPADGNAIKKAEMENKKAEMIRRLN